MPAALKLWNSLSGKKEDFVPYDPNEVKIYCCGPTVYGYTHVGNARAALTLDLAVRSLQRAGFKTKVARNYTDVDDKIIDAAKKEGLSTNELALKYERAYADELRSLNTIPPDHTPRATENIEQMIKLSQTLISKSHAYSIKGDVYFRVLSDKSYGKLSRRKIDDMIAGVRIEADEEKEHPADFALWKAAKEGEPSWPSPWGPGRPGWHIECSAMIQAIFGDSIDIHMGGLDLIFPHHENEIAQSECATGRPLAKYWVHNGLLEINSEKMSKSLGNIMRTHDFIRDYGGELLRLLLYSVHYRSPIDFSNENILRTELLLQRLYHCLAESRAAHEDTIPADIPAELRDLKSKLDEALFDDLGSAKALGLILGAARVCFREQKSALWKAWSPCANFLQEAFGILHQEPREALDAIRDRKLKRTGISEEQAHAIEKLLEERTNARLQKNFARSDQIRMELEAQGIIVMDSPEGSSWSVK